MDKKIKSKQKKAQKTLVRELSKIVRFSGNQKILEKVLNENPKLVHSLICKIRSGKKLGEIIRLFDDDGHLEIKNVGSEVWITYVSPRKKKDFLVKFQEEVKSVFEEENYEPRTLKKVRRKSLTDLGLSEEVVSQIDAMVIEESADL